MSQNITITATRQVEDASVLFVQSARYKGSAPFSGVFAVWDLDHCIRVNPETGQKQVDVICGWKGTVGDDETLILDLDDVLPEGGIGYEGEVVASIDDGS